LKSKETPESTLSSKQKTLYSESARNKEKTMEKNKELSEEDEVSHSDRAMLERHLEQASNEKPELSQTKLALLYTVLFFMNMFANCDHGILPAGTIGI
jgi:hypothetical protein